MTAMRSPVASGALRVAVTGASGFIGENLLSALSRSGHAVLGLTRKGRGTPGDTGRVMLDRYDNTDALENLLTGCDAVVHLAALAHRSEKSLQSGESFDANVSVTAAVARSAHAAGVRRFVFISSVGVNGLRTYGQPFNELDAPCPQEAYARSKLTCEQQVLELARQHPDFEVVIVRPPLVHGPQAPGNFGKLWRAVARGVPLPFGAIDNRRSVIGVDNLADLIIRCIVHPGASNQTYLASDGEDVSTANLILRMGLAMQRPARLINVPAPLLRLAARMTRQQDLLERLEGSLQVDSRKVRLELGWSPPFTLDEGLRRIAEADRTRIEQVS